jgi:hypothetical protein
MLEQGRFEEACRSFQQAIRLGYAEPDAGLNLALALLTLGRLPEGWPWYESRWQHWGARHLPQPFWDGSPLDRRTILLHGEQGLGDTIQFLRFAPLVKERGGTVVLVCQPALVGIASSCAGIDTVVPMDAALPAFDVQAPLMSLPRIFGTRLETIPAKVPYLHAEPARVDHWRKELSHPARFKVGMVWKGSHVKAGRLRSAPLAAFAPLARVPGVALYSLQTGEGSERLACVDFPITDLGSRSVPLDNLAAILRNLDLLVSVDTAPAHLAGALGVPVWLALRSPPDWRWFLDRSDSPWYPATTLFRQQRTGDWTSVFETMADALQRLVTQSLAPGGPGERSLG